jgi:cbb3-type cytochrome oxidase maturation protein
MHIIFFMIGVSLLMALGFLGAFFWSMKTGQQDDLYTPSMRMLLDDETPVTPETEPTVH